MPTPAIVITTSNKPATQPSRADAFRTGLSRVGYYGPLKAATAVWKRIPADDAIGQTTWTRTT